MRSRSIKSSPRRILGDSQANKPECNSGRCQNELYIIGIGPGNLEYVPRRAVDILQKVGTVVGYTAYIDLIRPIIMEKRIISTGMTREIQRVEAAIDAASSGEACAIVSSGDPGIYAMAGLVFETCHAKTIQIAPLSQQECGNDGLTNTLYIEVVPGIPALCAGASLLGAPLAHDFAVISLSDLLTPWRLIEKRIEAAAQADFVIVLYNPKSKKRTWQLEKAQQVILKYRDENTPVGIVTRAMRKRQYVDIITLGDLPDADINMQTTVFVGSRTSNHYLNFMYTPRGYSGKYKINRT